MTEDVLISADRGVGRIRLNRPKALHALTTQMCEKMSEALLRWRTDSNIECVVIDHAVGRGFCAGGDVVMLAKSGAGDAHKAREFFFAEYRLNHLLFTYEKPTVAIMDGVTMGGGVGISQPCTFRVATENTRLAMPETGIGLFPDVGGGWYLSRLPGRVGQFMALTGARLNGSECAYLGLATHYVSSSAVEELVDRILKSPGRVQGALGAASEKPAEARISESAAQINRLFASDNLEEILTALEAEGSEWAEKELITLGTKSPLSCKVSLRLLAQGADRATFADEMRAEYALAGRVVRTHDFKEGVTALLIEKHNEPKWDPATPQGVTEAMLDDLFASLPPDQQWSPFPETATMTDYKTVLVETRGAVTLVTLNRPDALNALNSEVLEELIEVFAGYDSDDSQRCLVLTGSGEKAFAAGADIKEMQPQGFADMYASDFFAGWEKVTATRKPWIAAVNGFALGGGCEVAMMADFIIASENAKFGQPEIKLGVTPGMGGSQRLTWAIGKAKAMEMCLTGRMMGAAEAEVSGLVAKVVPADQLLDEAMKTAESIASMAPLAAIAAKEMVNAAFEMPLNQGIRFERRLFHGLFGTEDQKEGMTAFVEKRPGNWKGK